MLKDMLWRDGLLIKLESMGIGGRMFNWVLDFLKDRNIEVRVGATHSRVYPTENGVPQESVCSPLLFSIMINDIFSELMLVLEGLCMQMMGHCG